MRVHCHNSSAPLSRWGTNLSTHYFRAFSCVYYAPDVDVPDPEEKSIVTYVAQFLQYSNDMPAPDDHLQVGNQTAFAGQRAALSVTSPSLSLHVCCPSFILLLTSLIKSLYVLHEK